LKPPRFSFARSRLRKASKFRQRRVVAFTAACCYAKSAPIALRRGDFDEVSPKGAEALGRKPEFEFGRLGHAAIGPVASAVLKRAVASP